MTPTRNTPTPHFDTFYRYDELTELLRGFGDDSVVLKDFVKSRKHEWAEACFIPRASDSDAAAKVVRRFVELQEDDLEGGFVFRAFVDLGLRALAQWALS